MNGKIMKQEKGITLIALVITIIVLLILAGVAISMLSGENGILTRASEAKEKTEEAQKKEEIGLASMELETYFITNNLKYKCTNGYVTGLGSDDYGNSTETVKSFEEKLPDKYEIKYRYKRGEGDNIPISTEEKSELKVSTGMAIVKTDDGGKETEVARTVLFGDIDGDGEISDFDSAFTTSYIDGGEAKDYVVVAMDVNGDGYISAQSERLTDEEGNDIETVENQLTYQLDNGTIVKSDTKLIINSSLKGSSEKINQNRYAISPKDLKELGMRTVVKEFLESNPNIFSGTAFKLEANYDEKCSALQCSLKGVTATTTVKNVLDNLPNIDANIFKIRVTYNEGDYIQSGSSLRINIDEKYEVSRLSFDIKY